MKPSLSEPPAAWRFGVFEVNVRAGELLRRGVKVKLQDQPFRVLLVLIENGGDVVTREELRRQIWPDGTFVDFENGLNSAINRLRDALGDSAEKPHYIETLPRRGYRFIGSAEAGQAAAIAVVSPPPRAVEKATAQATGTTPVNGRWRNAWAWLAAGLVVLASVGMTAVWRNTRAATAIVKPNAKVMLAVLPFENLTGSDENEYFVEGVNEEIISSLGRLRPTDLGVIARTSILRYKATRKPIDEIGRELNVNYVLEGSVRREGDRVRVTAQLIQVTDQTHLWAETFEREFRDSLQIQSDIAGRVARTLAMELLPAAQASQARQLLLNSEARTEYMKGRHLWNRRTENYPELAHKARERYQAALRIEPGYALVWAGLADIYNNLGINFPAESKRWFAEARTAATRALEIDPELAAAHSAFGWTMHVQDRNFSAAEDAFRRAVQLEPNFADGRSRLAQFLGAMGRYREGEVEARQAIALDPMSRMNNNVLQWMLLLQGRYVESIEHYRSFMELETDPAAAHYSLAVLYVRAGDCESARKHYALAKQRAQPTGYSLLYAANVELKCGSREAAQRYAAESEAFFKKQQRPTLGLVALYDVMGDVERAARELETYEKRGDFSLVFLNLQAYSNALNSHPRVQAVRKRLGLPNPNQTQF